MEQDAQRRVLVVFAPHWRARSDGGDCETGVDLCWANVVGMVHAACPGKGATTVLWIVGGCRVEPAALPERLEEHDDDPLLTASSTALHDCVADLHGAPHLCVLWLLPRALALPAMVQLPQWARRVIEALATARRSACAFSLHGLALAPSCSLTQHSVDAWPILRGTSGALLSPCMVEPLVRRWLAPAPTPAWEGGLLLRLQRAQECALLHMVVDVHAAAPCSGQDGAARLHTALMHAASLPVTHCQPAPAARALLVLHGVAWCRARAVCLRRVPSAAFPGGETACVPTALAATLATESEDCAPCANDGGTSPPPCHCAQPVMAAWRRASVVLWTPLPSAVAGQVEALAWWWDGASLRVGLLSTACAAAAGEALASALAAELADEARCRTPLSTQARAASSAVQTLAAAPSPACLAQLEVQAGVSPGSPDHALTGKRCLSPATASPAPSLVSAEGQPQLKRRHTAHERVRRRVATTRSRLAGPVRAGAVVRRRGMLAPAASTSEAAARTPRLVSTPSPLPAMLADQRAPLKLLRAFEPSTGALTEGAPADDACNARVVGATPQLVRARAPCSTLAAALTLRVRHLQPSWHEVCRAASAASFTSNHVRSRRWSAGLATAAHKRAPSQGGRTPGVDYCVGAADHAERHAALHLASSDPVPFGIDETVRAYHASLRERC